MYYFHVGLNISIFFFFTSSSLCCNLRQPCLPWVVISVKPIQSLRKLGKDLEKVIPAMITSPYSNILICIVLPFFCSSIDYCMVSDTVRRNGLGLKLLNADNKIKFLDVVINTRYIHWNMYFFFFKHTFSSVYWIGHAMKTDHPGNMRILSIK